MSTRRGRQPVKRFQPVVHDERLTVGWETPRRRSRDLARLVVVVVHLVVPEVLRLDQQPLEVLLRRLDVQLGGGLLDQRARRHHHDVRVLREVADEHRKVRVLHLVKRAARKRALVGRVGKCATAPSASRRWLANARRIRVLLSEK